MKDRLKKLRRELNLTQAEFAKRIGSVQNTITGYESGRRNPSNPVIASICKEFNVNEEWLRTGSGEMFKAAPSAALDVLAGKYGLTHGDYVLIEKFVNLKAEKREAIIDFILEAAKALSSDDVTLTTPAVPVLSFDSLSVDEKVELYRRELEREEKAEEKSEVS